MPARAQPGSAQYNFVVNDLKSVNRAATPWLAVVFHAPPYHSYYTHYKEMDCFLSIYENLFYAAKVDFVVNGHVHAYERTHGVYNYMRDVCGPTYITVGDGGNIEGPYRDFVDDTYPAGSTAGNICTQAWGSKNFAAAAGYETCPYYQLTAQPPTCPVVSFQPAQPGTTAGSVPGPNGGYWCQSAQPAWSAYRDASFGFAGMTIFNDTVASLSWYRNVDQNPAAGSPLVAADTAYLMRSTTCPAPPPPSPNPPPPSPSPPPPSPPLFFSFNSPAAAAQPNALLTAMLLLLVCALARLQ